MNRITSITRNEIFDVLLNTFTEDYLLGVPRRRFNFWGVLAPVDFLERLYNLENIPSKDKHYINAKEELDALKYNVPTDYQWDWLFKDDRFPVKNGTDEELLDFLCTVLHPEVRNDKDQDFGSPIWQMIWQKLNILVANDGYIISVDGSISNHVVYSWYDNTKQSLRTIKENDILHFYNLFARNGSVLNFSSEDFRKFTKSVIGLELCPIYINSKEKSFFQFLHEGKEEDVKLLLINLFEYYEKEDIYVKESQYDSHYINQYKICKRIINKFYTSEKVIESYTRELTKEFSSEYMSFQTTLMIEMQKKNPTEAIGKAKELIESCCTTILKDRNKSIGKDWKIQQLVKATMEVLKITPKNIPDDIPESETMKALLGNLAVIAQNIATLRNKYGSGHGKSADFKGLEERHAKLAVGSAVTLVDFLWTSHRIR